MRGGKNVYVPPAPRRDLEKWKRGRTGGGSAWLRLTLDTLKMNKKVRNEREVEMAQARPQTHSHTPTHTGWLWAISHPIYRKRRAVQCLSSEDPVRLIRWFIMHSTAFVWRKLFDISVSSINNGRAISHLLETINRFRRCECGVRPDDSCLPAVTY